MQPSFWPKDFVLVQLLFMCDIGLVPRHCSLVTPFQVVLLPRAWCCPTLPQAAAWFCQSLFLPCTMWECHLDPSELPFSLKGFALFHWFVTSVLVTFYLLYTILLLHLSWSLPKISYNSTIQLGVLLFPHCPLLWLIHLK